MPDNQLSFGYTSGATLYAILTDTGGAYALAAGGSEAFVPAHWPSYAIPVPETSAGSGRYALTVPAIPAGSYRVEVHEQSGGSPSPTADPLALDGSLDWSGTAIVSGGGATSDPWATATGSYSAGTFGALVASSFADPETGITYPEAIRGLLAYACGTLAEPADHSTSTFAAAGNPNTPRIASTNTRTGRVVTLTLS